MTQEISFSRIHLEGWRQLDNVDIEFHPKLTVITGANGAGKSTILSILSRHVGWHRNFLSTPKIQPTGTVTFMTSIFKSIFGISTKPSNDENYVGSITYSNQQSATIRLPGSVNTQYDLELSGQQAIVGLHIDSHSPSYNYAPVSLIPTVAIPAINAFNNYNSELHSRSHGGSGGQPPIYRIKEAIISMAAFGEGNSTIARNQDALDCYNGFIGALKKTLPESIGFEGLSIRLPDIVIVTKTGEFMFDAASGGLMTIIDTTFRLYMFSRGKSSFVVTMDEPENHLHPSMQRSLMGRLIDAFPAAQFIVATHSPFIVSSVRDSFVYALRYRDQKAQSSEGFSVHRTVVSEKLDTINRAGNAGEILREVLGVQSTMPEWVESDMNQIVLKYASLDLNKAALVELRKELAAIGQSEYYPDALKSLLNHHDKN